jgi:N-acetylglucosaminyldiphosphoundecaprenol N-acetyl-beta-D-mannosaminyltransferase
LNKGNGSCFYFGSSQKTLELITERIKKEYPNIKVGYLAPPFKPNFTAEDNNEFVKIINAFEPDVLFVGLTAPKQEKWAFINQNKIKTKYICTIGVVFDFYAGTVKKPNPILVKLGLEWLSRFLNDPKHMLKRYKKLPITSFLIEILKYKLRKA